MALPIVSILVTTYECQGMGPLFTDYSLKKMIAQTYRPLQIVVSDHSQNDEIEEVVRSLDTKGVDLIYTRYKEHYGNPSANWTNALKHATGAYINYFAMDDYLVDDTAVERAVAEMEANPSAQWFAFAARVTPYMNLYQPRWPASILKDNLLGGPSCVIFRSSLKHIELSPQFIWLLDVDWYYRLFLAAGPPHISQSVYYVNRILPPYQLTTTVCNQELRQMENALLAAKYKIPKEMPLSTNRMSFIRRKYEQRCETPSDIYEHLPTLHTYASQCSHITECGVRDAVSCYAFAAGLLSRPDRNAQLVLVDIEESSLVNIFLDECEHEGLPTTYHVQSDLTCPMEETDLLFIDTFHVYGQLKRELERWHSNVKKYIILHDTEVDKIEGECIRNSADPVEASKQTGLPVEEITRGLWPAVEEFLAANPAWKLREHFENCNGLTVLERV